MWNFVTIPQQSLVFRFISESTEIKIHKTIILSVLYSVELGLWHSGKNSLGGVRKQDDEKDIWTKMDEVTGFGSKLLRKKFRDL